MLRAGPEGFTGGMSARKYVALTGCSGPTATRDLSLLDSIFEHMIGDQYPPGNRLGAMVVWQLGEFREQRAVLEEALL